MRVTSSPPASYGFGHTLEFSVRLTPVRIKIAYGPVQVKAVLDIITDIPLTSSCNDPVYSFCTNVIHKKESSRSCTSFKVCALYTGSKPCDLGIEPIFDTISC